MRYTVREFEEAVIGAQIRYEHLVDVVMRHALATGQWTTPKEFRDLTGRDEPLPLDPRPAPPLDPDELDRRQRTMEQFQAHHERMRGQREARDRG